MRNEGLSLVDALGSFAPGQPLRAALVLTYCFDGRWFEEFMTHATIEQWIVAYADKRASQRLISMEERFADWERRYPSKRRGAEGRAVRARADELERTVCATAGVAPSQVRRLAWTSVALRTARQIRTAA